MAFKLFQDGNILTAQEVMDYMMKQQIMVFADDAARDAALTSPEEGMFAFLRSNDKLTYFNGSIWRNY